MKPSEGESHSRRTVLKASVAGAAIPFAVNTVTGRQGDDPVVIRRQGSWTDPLDVGEMMDLKRQAIKLHEQRGGTVEFDEFVNAVPGVPDGAELVDYTVGVLPTGRPIQHVGLAGNAASVPGVRDDADENADRIRQRVSGGDEA